MNEKITIQYIIELLTKKHGMTKKDAETFVKGMFELIEEALTTEKYVKVKGLGTFKLTEVESRESVNVNTGERFEIQGHTKVTFTPDSGMKDLINKPFAHFETVVLNEGTKLEDTETEVEEEGEDSKEAPTVAEPVTPAPAGTEEEKGKEEEEEKEKKEEEIEKKEEEKGETEDEKGKTVKMRWYIVAAVILLLCIAGGAYLYLLPGKALAPQAPAVINAPQAQPDAAIPATASNDSLANDTVHAPAAHATGATGQPQQDASPVAASPAASLATAHTDAAKETLADTVEYDITGTKARHTLQEGESLVKLSVRFYGTKKLWPYIVRHNKGVIKDADKVPVGTKLRIPELTPKK